MSDITHRMAEQVDALSETLIERNAEIVRLASLAETYRAALERIAASEWNVGELIDIALAALLDSKEEKTDG